MLEHEIPEELKAQAENYREKMLDTVSIFDDELAELFLEGADIPEEVIKRAVRT